MGNTNITLPDGQSTATTDQVDTKIAAQIAAGPPVNVDVPHATQEGNRITCTMGNWEGEPRDYLYVWLRNGDEELLADGPSIEVTADDVGDTFACQVTASHSGGATSVISNDVVATDPGAV